MTAASFSIVSHSPRRGARFRIAQTIRTLIAIRATMLTPLHRTRHTRPATADLERSLQDPSGAVQVAAAEALFALGLTDKARAPLEQWINHPQPGFDSLCAATVLSRSGLSAATPSLPTLRSALARVANEKTQGDPKQYLRRILERTIAELEHRESPLVHPSAISPAPTAPPQ